MINLSEVVEGVIDLSMKRYDAIIEGVVEPVGDIGTPRQLEGKVSEWTPEQHQKLALLFHKDGEPEPCPYCQAIGEESIDNMHEAEQGEADAR